jgi:spore germination protein KC
LPSSAKGCLAAALLCLAALLLAGCWDRLELNKWAFVQAIAVDLTEDGQLRLTHQIYRPGSTEKSSMSPSSGASTFNITSTSDTVYGASLTASSKIGRRLQWSHMDSLIISEQFARERTLGEVLDFFSRSNEPKSNLTIVIVKGEAQSHLRGIPLVETSSGQQLASNIVTAQTQAATSLVVNLTDISILSKEPDSTFIIPYLQPSGDDAFPSSPTFALFRFPEGKLVRVVPAERAPFLLMLMNRYRSGQVSIPCRDKQGGDGGSESFKIVSLQTKVKPRANNDQLSVRVDIQVSGSVMELVCTRLETEEDIKGFTDKISEKLEAQLASTIAYLQEQEADIIGVGTHLHHWHKGLWKKWKGDWGERFKNSEFEVEVHVRLNHTGIDTGQPFSTSSW